MSNVMTVENWINSYQLSNPAQIDQNNPGLKPKPVFPRLEQIQQKMLADKTIISLEQCPIVNPMTSKPEWPMESPRPIKNYRSLSTDRSSLIGKGTVEFIPFIAEDGDTVCGYLIRAGDPDTGRVLCSDGMPYVRLSSKPNTPD